jgi:hypothetical protein
MLSVKFMLRWYKEGQQQFSSHLIGEPNLNWRLESIVSRQLVVAAEGCQLANIWPWKQRNIHCWELLPSSGHMKTADREDLVCAVVICRVCELVTAL